VVIVADNITIYHHPSHCTAMSSPPYFRVFIALSPGSVSGVHLLQIEPVSFQGGSW